MAVDYLLLIIISLFLVVSFVSFFGSMENGGVDPNRRTLLFLTLLPETFLFFLFLSVF